MKYLPQIVILVKKHPIGRGVLPDYAASYQVDDILMNKDLEMEIARKLIIKAK